MKRMTQEERVELQKKLDEWNAKAQVEDERFRAEMRARSDQRRKSVMKITGDKA